MLAGPLGLVKHVGHLNAALLGLKEYTERESGAGSTATDVASSDVGESELL